MCGFSGAYSIQPVELSRFEKSLDIIQHRGPDAKGIFQSTNKKCSLAHVRLSILDTGPNANQPMIKGKQTIIYNGEVYNHMEIRNELKADFKTTCDTETILTGYSSLGKDIFNKLSGMFAGAIYDEDSKELVLVRDSLGIKNLYYYETPTGIYFSSEIKGLLNLINFKPVPDAETIKCYMKFENYPQGLSFFKGIKNLLPGEIRSIILNDQINASSSFIKTKVSEVSLSGTLKDQGKKIIEEAVYSHLLSDVPLGVYLSGGIDSSLVATIASKKIKDLEGFTGYFESEDSYYDERHYSRLVAQAAGIHLNEVKITPQDFLESFDQVIWHLDEPRMGMGAFSQYIVAREAAKKRKVILAGHGGDELFGGYPMFKAFWLYSNIGLNSKSFKFSKQVKSKEWIWIFYLMFKKMKEGKLYFAPEIFENVSSELSSVFSTNDNDKPLDQLMNYYKSVYIPGLLNVEDKISMAHSLETRVPLWSIDIYNWAYSLPPEIKLKNGNLKDLLREIAKDYLPAELFHAEKRGFPTPLRLWFRNELKDFIKERLLKESPILDQYVTLRSREKLVNEHISKALPFAFDEKRAHKIWMLLCIESWSRQYNL